MNWYKISQQNLLFYPWDRHPSLVTENAQPSYTNPGTGQEYYKCSVCGEEKPAENIVDWYKSKDVTRQYNYPTHNMDRDSIYAAFVKIKQLLIPYYNAFSKARLAGEKEADIFNNASENAEIDYWKRKSWGDNDFEMDAPDLAAVCKSQEIVNYTHYVQKALGSGYNYGTHHNIYNSLTEIANSGKVDGYILSHLSRDFDELGEIIKDIPDFNALQSNPIQIHINVPVCDECEKEALHCVACEKPIYDGQSKYEMVNEGYACDSCVENGRISTCSECGLSDWADDMNYAEDQGDFCSSCYDLIKSSYEDYHSHEIDNIVEKKGKNAFASWFEDSDRTYIPFASQNKMSRDDKVIIEMINENAINNEPCYTDAVGYQDGVATCGRRQWRIGKLLQRMARDKLKKIDNLSDEEVNFDRATAKQNIVDDMKMLQSGFEKSKFRALGSEVSERLMVVISMNPHDIAKMSTNRKWTSCMDLSKPGGGRSRDVYEEVKEGGLVAYLTKKDDTEVEDPIARLLIRRYENKEKISLAVPENRVYGETRDDDAFYKAVENWVKSKQGEIPKGRYFIKGMEYVDGLNREIEIANRAIKEIMIKMAARNNNFKLSAINAELSSSITRLLIMADRGYPLEHALMHNIVAQIPDALMLQQAIDLSIMAIGQMSGSYEITEQRQNVINAIWNAFQGDKQQDDNIQEGVNDGMVMENIGTDGQPSEGAGQVQSDSLA
jgi:hypothetical protein